MSGHVCPRGVRLTAKGAKATYVGKPVPKGSRKSGLVKHHADSIQAATNLNLKDFHFRYLVVDDIWIPLGETYMIEKFQPVWNMKVDGFGNKTPGERRKTQYTSLWDTVHPGRSYVTHLNLPPNPKTAAQILKEMEEYLEMPQEEKAKFPVVDDGGLADTNSD